MKIWNEDARVESSIFGEGAKRYGTAFGEGVYASARMT